jgi:hypothetical protein
MKYRYPCAYHEGINEADAKLHVFIALDSSQCSAVCPDRFILGGKSPSTH